MNSCKIKFLLVNKQKITPLTLVSLFFVITFRTFFDSQKVVKREILQGKFREQVKARKPPVEFVNETETKLNTLANR